jgi:hypothetical protein
MNMKHYFRFLLMMMIFCVAEAGNSAAAITMDAATSEVPTQILASEPDNYTSESNLISLVKYNKGIALFKVGICPADAKIDVDIKFTPAKDPAIVYAELSFRVPKSQCFANTSQLVTVDIPKKIKEISTQKNIKASYILMKSIPNQIEVDLP